jgi:molybdopterin converting factor small subunit
MKVTVELLSPLSVITGYREPFPLELANSATGLDLIRALGQQVKHPLFMTQAAETGRFMLLVNKAYASPDTPLSEGDRVSVVLRMSGI